MDDRITVIRRGQILEICNHPQLNTSKDRIRHLENRRRLQRNFANQYIAERLAAEAEWLKRTEAIPTRTVTSHPPS